MFSLGWSWGTKNQNQNSYLANLQASFKGKIPTPTWIYPYPKQPTHPKNSHPIPFACRIPAEVGKENGLHLQLSSSWCQAAKAKSWLSNAHWCGTSKEPTATGALVVEASGDGKTCHLWHQFQHLLCHCAKPSARAERLRIFDLFRSGPSRACVRSEECVGVCFIRKEFDTCEFEQHFFWVCNDIAT